MKTVLFAHKCPVCNGTGLVSKPPYISGDQQTWIDNVTAHLCQTCNGATLIWQERQVAFTYQDLLVEKLKTIEPTAETDRAGKEFERKYRP